MVAQLYKVPAGKMDPTHDASGDYVYRGDDCEDIDVCGLVLRLGTDGKLLILLFKAEEVPPHAEIILHYCDAVAILREEADANPVLEQKLQIIKSSYGDS